MSDIPVKQASYPESWSRTFPGVDYRVSHRSTTVRLDDIVRTMLEAAEILENSEYLDSAKKAGDFVLLAQMPDPQPALAQQYDLNMQPAWAGKFEPPAVTGGESQGLLRLLMFLYRKTGDRRYLEPFLAHSLIFVLRNFPTDDSPASMNCRPTNPCISPSNTS